MKPQYFQWHAVLSYGTIPFSACSNMKLENRGIWTSATFAGSKRVEGLLYPICDLDVVVFQRLLLLFKSYLFLRRI